VNISNSINNAFRSLITPVSQGLRLSHECRISTEISHEYASVLARRSPDRYDVPADLFGAMRNSYLCAEERIAMRNLFGGNGDAARRGALPRLDIIARSAENVAWAARAAALSLSGRRRSDFGTE
jgi:hypothetical protein